MTFKGAVLVRLASAWARSIEPLKSHVLHRCESRITATTPVSTTAKRNASTSKSIIESWHPPSFVPVTIHSFPTLEPRSIERYPVQHLYLPLRRDILHHAIIYEGDKTRQGTASSKTRYEVHGSHQKIRRQKGTGKARLGTHQSPMLRGGGKTFGPHPRDFSTRLNRKVYDQAWRIALSYRYRKGELLICEDGMDLFLPHDYKLVAEKYMKDGIREAYLQKYTKGFLDSLGLGRADGRTLFVTLDRREMLQEALGLLPHESRWQMMDDVDIKDLLETSRVIMERSVLRKMIEQHQSDLLRRTDILDASFNEDLETHRLLRG